MLCKIKRNLRWIDLQILPLVLVLQEFFRIPIELTINLRYFPYKPAIFDSTTLHTDSIRPAFIRLPLNLKAPFWHTPLASNQQKHPLQESNTSPLSPRHNNQLDFQFRDLILPQKRSHNVKWLYGQPYFTITPLKFLISLLNKKVTCVFWNNFGANQKCLSSKMVLSVFRVTILEELVNFLVELGEKGLEKNKKISFLNCLDVH